MHGMADPVFTIAGPARAGLAVSLLPDGFAPKGAAPIFTISGPGNESRVRALEQRCEDQPASARHAVPLTSGHEHEHARPDGAVD